MIITVIVEHCPKCRSTNIIRNGHDYKGAQKYSCHACGAYGTLNPQRGYSEPEKEQICRAYQERMSMRGVQRVFGVAVRTLAQWLKAKAARLPDLVETLLTARADDVLELDELWSFVLKKANKRWIWIALCRRTRQVVAFFIGDRSDKSCRELWKRIPAAYKRCHTYSDFWAAYRRVLGTATHQCVGKETGQTAHVERWNNTLRQRLARFVRKTLSFSKSDEFHKIALKLFIFQYNLDCVG
jgi:insertion element IS1 protein InsB